MIEDKEIIERVNNWVKEHDPSNPGIVVVMFLGKYRGSLFLPIIEESVVHLALSEVIAKNMVANTALDLIMDFESTINSFDPHCPNKRKDDLK